MDKANSADIILHQTNETIHSKRNKTMKLGTQILNDVQRLLIDFANEEGIVLANDFSTVDEFKRFVIGFTFKALTDIGLATDKAYDIIFGDGAYVEMAANVWNQLRK